MIKSPEIKVNPNGSEKKKGQTYYLKVEDRRLPPELMQSVRIEIVEGKE
jgi:hypothetical protein